VNKSEIRQKILNIRKKKYFENFSVNFDSFLKIIKNKNIKKKVIGGYYPYNYESNILDILKKLEKKKFTISLPKIKKNNQMNFYEWSFYEPLVINTFGIPEPISKKKIYPDILLVPLVAFDNDLNRLGYGGGFYDRYLKKIKNKKKIVTIGIGFAFQKIQKIPTNKHDMKLDYIITEKNLI
jgi:5-formyltetrahydrofolate cyclo-ligase